MKRLLSIVAVGALAVSLVACGDDDDSGSSATTAAGASATDGSAPAPRPPREAARRRPTTGSDETTGSSAGGTEGGTEGAAAGEAATERIKPLLEPITKIPVTEKLEAAPAKGKKLYWLEGNIQSILPITGGFEAAAKAIGWDLTTITYDPSDPQGPNAAMQQAVDAGADFIAISGQPVTAIETALAAAKAQDIPVFAMFGENEADPDKGIVAVVGGLNTTASNSAEPRRLGDLRLEGRGRRPARQPARLHDPAVRREAADRPLRGVVHELQATTCWRRRSPTSPPATSRARSCRTCSRTPT